MSETVEPKPASPAAGEVWLPRVLVVDDSLTRRTWIGDWLHERGFPFRTARDGVQAMELIEASPLDGRPELVVSDLHMPRMSGSDLVRALKAGATTRGIAVLLYTTSLLDHPSYSAGTRQQAADFLNDAIDFDGLTIAIEQKVQHMRSLRNLDAARRALRPDPGPDGGPPGPGPRRPTDPGGGRSEGAPRHHSAPIHPKKDPDKS